MKGFALVEGKLGELRLTLVPNVMMSNACRTDICRLLSPTVFRRLSQRDQFAFSTASRYQKQPSDFFNRQRALAGFVVSSDIGRENGLSGLP